MYESKIAAGPLTVTAAAGFPADIDTLAHSNLSGHGFLRAAWYRGNAKQPGRTLLIRRGGDADGALIAAIPTTAFGPAIARARKVAGYYWPFRSALLAPDCLTLELAQALQHPTARSELGPVWRVGPVNSQDPITQRLVEAAQIAGLSVLSRPAGTSWLVDLERARDQGYPRGSVAAKLRTAWRKLEALGTPSWRSIRGEGWNAQVIADLARIEGESWVARTTDGSGAKFLTPDQRALWQHVVTDPIIAQGLCATILMLDDRPIAFSFDLDDGPMRYVIAGGYVEDLKRLYIGKLTNFEALGAAIAHGQKVMDCGAGDSGYKREMGAEPGYEFADLLFVRSRLAARVLARAWGAPLLPMASADG